MKDIGIGTGKHVDRGTLDGETMKEWVYAIADIPTFVVCIRCP